MKNERIIIYDCYNHNIPKNQDVIGTVVQHFSRWGMTNGYKIIELETMEEKNQINLPEELKGKKFRIRKLTPKECFRLMGVDDADIEKIQASGVSNSGQYKLAGNSIVVDVLFHLFRKMFIETGPEKSEEPQQLSLF